MAKITFITQNQEKIILEATEGSLMELAVANGVSGIDGDCGGVCSCATCHVHVAPDFIEQAGAASETEKEMLEFDAQTNVYSRLSCQIPITESLDGIVLTVAH